MTREPNETELTIRVPTGYCTAPCRYAVKKDRREYGEARDEERVRYAARAVQFHPHGGQSDFVWLPARTMHPHVGPQYVW